MANIITSCRILFSMGILCFPAFSPEFYTMYFLCGFSDMIDGTIARKTNAVSEFGSKLDTVADFVFVVVCSIKLLPLVHIPTWLWIWIGVIAVIKTANIAWGFVHMKRFLPVHTVLNKITGFALFLLPLTFTFIEPTYTVLVVCCLATIAAIQERYCVAIERE
ncbi:MAG: CDP-alcohol phosphatidyltransferase family protein [Firmicutes bacterium]|nr:CDP-alcohol phosphatidyltransferase family protein [Bacillota bacterium]